MVTSLNIVARYWHCYASTMSTEKPGIWWTYDHAPTRWAIVGSFAVVWFLAIVFLFSDIVKVLALRPWWQDFIVALATVAVPILALLELSHSAEANAAGRTISAKRTSVLPPNLMTSATNTLSRLRRTRDAHSLQQNETRRQRRHLGACVSVTEGNRGWPSTPLTVEVSDANIVTLFTPRAGSNPQAS